jgi:hypothetical protein
VVRIGPACAIPEGNPGGDSRVHPMAVLVEHLGLRSELGRDREPHLDVVGHHALGSEEVSWPLGARRSLGKDCCQRNRPHEILRADGLDFLPQALHSVVDAREQCTVAPLLRGRAG